MATSFRSGGSDCRIGTGRPASRSPRDCPSRARRRRSTSRAGRAGRCWPGRCAARRTCTRARTWRASPQRCGRQTRPTRLPGCSATPNDSVLPERAPSSHTVRWRGVPVTGDGADGEERGQLRHDRRAAEAIFGHVPVLQGGARARDAVPRRRAARLRSGCSPTPNPSCWRRCRTPSTIPTEQRGLADVVADYYRTYGVGSASDVGTHVGTSAAAIRPALPDDLVPVTVDGARSSGPASLIDAVREADEPAARELVRLLPPFDPVLQPRDRAVLTSDQAEQKALWPALGARGRARRRRYRRAVANARVGPVADDHRHGAWAARPPRPNRAGARGRARRRRSRRRPHEARGRRLTQVALSGMAG